jgi:hypothetical protein
MYIKASEMLKTARNVCKSMFIPLESGLHISFLVEGDKIFFLIGMMGGGIQLGSLGTGTINGLLCRPHVIRMMEKLVEWLAGETEVLGENLPQCPYVHHKPHVLPRREPGPLRWETSD